MIRKLNFTERVKAFFNGTIEEANKAFLAGDDIKTNSVDAETAMKYSAVSACVRVRAETFASVPAILYQKVDDGRKQVSNLNIADILHSSPNPEMSAFSFKETMMTNFDVGGNIVCQRLIAKNGDLVGLYPFDHRVVEIKRDQETKKLIYTIGGKTVLQRNQILHVPNLSFDGVVGLSPISYAAASINTGLGYQEYSKNFYSNAALPSGVLEHPTALDDVSFERLKKDLAASYTGMKNAGVPMILEGGMEWKSTAINPIDAQLLESKEFQIEDICRIYRVPQHLVNKLDRSTNNNIEHQALEFVMYTMLPIFKRFEDCINSQLLTPNQRKEGYYVEFLVDGLLRGDSKSRAEAYAAGRQWGYMSANDIRRLENLPRIPNGDIYLQPSNCIEAGTTASTADKTVEDIYKMITERR